VDGKPRYRGVESFLQSRGIHLPFGSPDDPPGKETVCGLGNKKNQLFLQQLKKHGTEVYPHSIEFIKRLRSQGYKTGVVSSSKNCLTILESAHIKGLFDVEIDGVDLKKSNLKGKPAPDMFLEATRRLMSNPEQTAIVEDAIAGVQAGRNGNFGLVVGVDRKGKPEQLKKNGADVVISDFSQVTIEHKSLFVRRTMNDVPSALKKIDEIMLGLKGKKVPFFLDYDGTLTPIVQRPEQAILSDAMKNTLRELNNCCQVAVISGRDLADIRKMVGIDTIFYAGSHGFDISGPGGKHMEYPKGSVFFPLLDKAEEDVGDEIQNIPGSRIERKKFSIAVHYREVEENNVSKVKNAVEKTVRKFPKLKQSSGKKVFEIQPKVDWDKGKALFSILQFLDLDKPDVLPIYIGDDLTDEDALQAIQRIGIGIVVGDNSRPTYASYTLQDPDEVKQFLQNMMAVIGRENHE
jgi:trehalose-phosphatase